MTNKKVDKLQRRILGRDLGFTCKVCGWVSPGRARESKAQALLVQHMERVHGVHS